MTTRSLSDVRKEPGFNQRGTRWLMRVAALLTVVNVALLLLGMYAFYSREKQSDYYAVTCDSEPIKLDSLSTAVVSAPQLLDWAYSAAISMYNFNFGNWNQKVQEMRPLFSAEGWQAFYPNFKATQIDPAIEKSTFVTSVATDAPIIERRGAVNGIYRWRIAIPMLVTYQTSSDKAQQKIMVRLVISRVPTVQNPRGIAIVQFSADSIG